MQPHYLKDNFASFVSVQLHCERDLKRLGNVRCVGSRSPRRQARRQPKEAGH
jgi:hypothetical protein